MAGDPESCWTRRLKIHLSEISWSMVEEVQATPGAVIAGRFAGSDKNGQPSCASARPIEGGWRVTKKDPTEGDAN
jgi:hypothetical protein